MKYQLHVWLQNGYSICNRQVLLKCTFIHASSDAPLGSVEWVVLNIFLCLTQNVHCTRPQGLKSSVKFNHCFRPLGNCVFYWFPMQLNFQGTNFCFRCQFSHTFASGTLLQYFTFLLRLCNYWCYLMLSKPVHLHSNLYWCSQACPQISQDVTSKFAVKVVIRMTLSYEFCFFFFF